MTYRTNDTDNTFTSPSSVSAPVRNLRRRRYNAARSTNIGGSRIRGLGI